MNVTVPADVPPFDPLVARPAADVRADLGRVRGGCPVHRSTPDRGFVGRHALVREALRDTRALSNRGNFVLGDGDDSTGDHPSLITQSDPPEHTALRGLLRPAFTRAAVTGAAPWIRERVEEIVDTLPDGGPAEIIGDLAFPLTASVIARLVGVPPGDAAEIARLSTAVSDALPAPFVGTETWARLEAWFTAAARARRESAAPPDDLITALATGRVHGHELTDREVAFHSWQVFTAGLKTTAFTIGATVHQLLADRSRWEALLADPSLIESAREEGLRHTSAIRWVLRAVDETAGIGGETVRPGERVVVGLESANLDETVFGDDAADFVLGRPAARRHVAFGHGPHLCLGAELSRTEISAVLEVLTARLPTLALAPGAPAGEVDSAMFHGPRRVDVVW